MALTAAQTAAFFEHDVQMGMPHETVVQMATEGIVTVGDLAEFDKDSLQQLADNLRRPGGRIPDPNPNADPGATIPTPAFTFGVKSQKRLLAAADLVKHCNTTGRDLSAANLQWEHVAKNFEIQWKALKAKKDEDTPDVPKTTKALPVIKWTEAFQDFLNHVIGVRTISLCYVIRLEEAVPANAPPLATHQPHSVEHGSVEAELIARASHNHALFRDDNAAVYHYLEEATRATPCAASIKPFQRGKNGRGAWLALKGQCAGVDKWEAEIKRQEQLLHTRVWKGQSNFSLESFISQHRNAFVSMQACAQHVEHQLPNEHSRVGFLLEAIQCADPGLQAAMASIRTDNVPNGKRSDFEATAAHLLPHDPVAKKRAAGTKRGSSLISDVGGANVSATGAGKPSIGKSGVHLRWHTTAECKRLTGPQKKELCEWRQANPEAAKPPAKQTQPKGRHYTNKQLSSIVSKRVKIELSKNSEEQQEQEDGEAYIASLVKDAVNLQISAPAADKPKAPPTQCSASALKSILKRAKGGS